MCVLSSDGGLGARVGIGKGGEREGMLFSLFKEVCCSFWLKLPHLGDS